MARSKQRTPLRKGRERKTVYSCKVFGAAKELCRTHLPTKKDVILHFRHVQTLLNPGLVGRDASLADVADVVVKDIHGVWTQAGFTVEAVKHSKRRLLKLVTRYYSVKKALLRRKPHKCALNRVRLFQEECKSVFSVEGRAVPSTSGSGDAMAGVPLSRENSDTTPAGSDESEFGTPPAVKRARVSQHTKQTRLDLPSVALVASRTGIPPNQVGMLLSAGFQDAGVTSPGGAPVVVDGQKVRRVLARRGAALNAEHADSIGTLEAFFFDGKKDKDTLQQIVVNGRTQVRKATEEHIVLLQEPGGKYLGHVTVPHGDSTAAATFASIRDYFVRRNIALTELKAIGCDGCPTNTGVHGGVLRLFELLLGRPLQWLVCLLHMNELPFRHLFALLDGGTTGPSDFSGPVGKQIKTCEELPIVRFRSLPFVTPDVDLQSLNSDQHYLLRLCIAISEGQCSPELAAVKGGKPDHSRWLTTAARCLRLYMSTQSPTAAFKKIVKYIMEVYAPMWFAIKTRPTCVDGARHLHGLIRRSRYLPRCERECVDAVIQRNAFFGHPENILLGMLFDERVDIRHRAVEAVLQARELLQHQETVRCFAVPQLRFGARDYSELVHWTGRNAVTVTEPPLTAHLTAQQLELLARSGDSDCVLKTVPCHSQAVERSVRTVTEAAKVKCGETKRHESILGTLKSREKMPKFKTKCQFQ